ncbi:hypothetical protein OC846_000636 [Tilletia horrida]|uniref:Aminotransferase class I/classII large domain-containing protein n=1 Tax=Tilletia horrida TaxID=155126 RepID=A0AAN6H0G0_9BASI|nr:hypothetical protein OC846_000636 [Tilletia horrida]
MTSSNLSPRGRSAAQSFASLTKLAKVMRNIYDPETNPDGIVFLGLADNAVLRPEILEYFNSTPLRLTGPEMTYADRVCAQSSVLKALAHLYNTVPDGLDSSTFEARRKPLVPVIEDHLSVGSGASGILDSLMSCIADEGDGILLTTPYYNGFDHDIGARAQLRVVPVLLDPLSTTTKFSDSGLSGQPCFETGFLDHYEHAITKAKKEGIKVRVLLLCNPHNPTGAILSRTAVIKLCKFAAKHNLHLVSDEIYSRSIFATAVVPNPNEFHSVLSIDVLAEAGLNPAYVHVVDSMSKDFNTNGFRVGVLISQHNPELMVAMFSYSLFSQPGSVAGAMWRDWIYDKEFLSWYLKENLHRLRDMFEYVARWLSHHSIPYTPCNAGHFLLIDLSKFLPSPTHKEEDHLLDRMIDDKVFVAPGAQYHTTTGGFYRLTFSQPPGIVKEGLKRLETTLGLDSWITEQPVPDWSGRHRQQTLDRRVESLSLA